MDVVDVYWKFLDGCDDLDEDFLFLEDDDFGDCFVFDELVLFLDVFWLHSFWEINAMDFRLEFLCFGIMVNFCVAWDVDNDMDDDL